MGAEKRIVFAIPRHEMVIVGTTDTDYYAKPDEVESDRDDVEYLLQEAGRHLPNVQFRRENIVTTFAGLRPLVFAKGNPSKISRKHVIEENYTGVMYVMGGKYTTYRAIAQECVEKVLEKKLKLGMNYPVFGSGPLNGDEEELAKRYGIPPETITYLYSKYGSQVGAVLNLINKDKSLAQPLCTCSPAIKAQVIYSLQTELAVTPDDIIWRRLGLGYIFCASKQCRKMIEEMCRNAK